MRTREIGAGMAALLVVLSLSQALLLTGSVTASDTSLPSKIPPGVLDYISTHPESSGCISGTVSPFTISSVSCGREDEVVPGSTYTLGCSGQCFAGTYNSASNNFAGLAGYFTVPSNNPTVTYSNPTAAWYWIGLQSCSPSSSCSQIYLVQSGICYACNATAGDSQYPQMFVEYNQKSGYCHTFCGKTWPVNPGDSLFLKEAYYAQTLSWLMYAQDDSNSPINYITYYQGYCSSCGSGYIPYNSLPYALAMTEGYQTSSSNYWPSGTQTLTDMVGYDPSGNYQIGTSNPIGNPYGTAVTATVGSSQYGCNWVGPQTTCQSTSIAIS